MSAPVFRKRIYRCSHCGVAGHYRTTCERRLFTHSLALETVETGIRSLAVKPAEPPLPPPRAVIKRPIKPRKAPPVIAPPPVPPPPVKKTEAQKVEEEAQLIVAELKKKEEQKLHDLRVRLRVAELLAAEATEEQRITARMAELAELF